MITVYGIDDSVLYQVLESSSCVKEEELMVSDHIKLSWLSRTGESIPAGSYIKYQIGVDEDEEPIYEIYTLLENYKPVQKSEASWLYEPEFQYSIMGWQKVPFFMYTPIYDDEEEIIGYTRETDWTLTGGIDLFLDRIVMAIKQETGVQYTYPHPTVSESKSLSFSSVDVYSALNAIANEFETEWWVDKETLTIHVSKCDRGGTAINLEVGDNIHVPSVSLNSEGFYNRFYVFGSTRNIVQSYQGAGVNNLVNKRLTLDPEHYPGGYYEPHELAEGQQPFSKILIFDDIYPAATTLEAYDVRVEMRYVKDDNGNRIQIGTDSAGKPVYDVYAVYYIKVRYPDPTATGGYRQYIYNDWDYSETPERQGGDKPGLEGQKIAGLVPSIHFNSGSLLGREFEISQIHEHKVVEDVDGYEIILDAGDIQIQYVKNDNYIIPDYDTLVPAAGDKVILFNIKMPDEYIGDAYVRLEAKMLEEIEEKYTSDQNQYSFDSNPVAFSRSDPGLKIGTKVKYINGSYSLVTRVTKLTTKIAQPIVQNITVGNSLVKGTIQELKEEVTSANKNIDLIAALNDSTKAFLDAYNRTQQTILNNYKSLADLFTLTEYSSGRWALKLNPSVLDNQGNEKALDGFFTDGFITAGGVGHSGEHPGGATYLRLLEDVKHNTSSILRKNGTAIVDGDILAYDSTAGQWYAKAETGGSGGGTVTSVGLQSLSTALSISGSAITTSGTFGISVTQGYAIPTSDQITAWTNKQDAISDLATIRSNAALGATAVQPSALGNYYTKTQTYSQSEVNALIGAINQFHYEIYTVLPASGEGNVLYLIGPTGTGADQYEEYVWANNRFTKIGDTSIDLTQYALQSWVTSGFLGINAKAADSSKLNGQSASYYAMKDSVDTLSTVVGQHTTALENVVTLTGAQTVDGKKTFTGNINIPLAGAVEFGGTGRLMADANGNLTLGIQTKTTTIVGNSLHVNTMGSTLTETVSIIGSVMRFRTDLRPNPGSTYSLGDSTHRWKNIHADDLYATTWFHDSNNFITYDSANNAFKVNGNIYATGFMTAGGIGQGGSTPSVAGNLGAIIYIEGAYSLYIAVPTGTDISGCTLQVGRHRTQRQCLYHRSEGDKEPSTSGWKQLNTFPYNITATIPSSVSKTANGNDMYRVNMSGTKAKWKDGAGFEHSATTLSGIQNVFAAFITPDGLSVMHGRNNVKRAKWGLRLVKDGKPVTDWLSFHLIANTDGAGGWAISK